MALTLDYQRFQEASESPLEKMFWHVAHRCRGTWAEVVPQYQVGRYRLDGLFRTIDGQRIGIELDGAAYHDEARDVRRDGVILNSGKVDEIIRIPFAVVMYFQEGMLCVLAEWHREFNAHANVMCLSREEFMEELEREKENILNGCSRFSDIESYVAEVEPNYDVWWCDEARGWTVSPRSCLLRDRTKAKPIVRKRA